MKNNAAWDEMYANLMDWEAVSENLKEEKKRLETEFGYDSPEMEAWWERKDDHQRSFPYKSGEMKAYWKMRKMLEEDEEELIMDDSTFDYEQHDFITTLRKMGCETFVVTDTSTGLMRNIHGYTAEGCKMLGLCEIMRGSERFPEFMKGIRFSL